MSAQLVEIPGPPPLPLAGNLLQLPKTRPIQHLMALSRDYRGIFRLKFPNGTVLFVYSADLAAEVCDESRFRKAVLPPLSTLRDIGGDGLFTAYSNEPNWAKAHRVLMPAFGQRAMQGYFDGMLRVAQQLVRSWGARAGNDIPVAADMTRLTLDTISLTGFDFKFNSFETEELHPFLKAMGRVLIAAMIKSTRLPVRNLFSSQKRYRADIAVMNRLVDDVIRSRREHPTEAPDLLNLMLNTVDPQTGEKLDDLNIRYQVLTFLIAGHETTSGLLSFALYLLLRYPHVLARAYAEVDRVFPGDTVPTYARLSDLDVIERVLKETLRLWPTAPAFTLVPLEDTVIGGRYRVSKRDAVSVLIPALHRDPQVWTDPETFDIDRFLPEAEAKLPRHAYKPFGNGRRACIGRQFALTEAKLALAMILQNFALQDPYDYRLNVRETLTLKPDAFYIRARRRQPHEKNVAAARPDKIPAQIVEARAPTARADGERFTVLYGTNLGTSREIAEQIGEHARRAGFAAEVAPIDAYADDPPQAGVLVVVTATYNGKAPDSARDTAAKIESGAFRAVQRPNLRYAVLGCGNSQWPDYQEFSKLIDATLRETGAVSILPRAEADGNGNFDAAVTHWAEQLWKALGESGEAHALAAPRIDVTYASEPDALTAVLPAPVHAMTVAENVELVRDPSGLWDFALEAPRASVRHIRLRLPEGAIYRTGDHAAIYPRNRPELIQAIAARLGREARAVVVLAADSKRVQYLPLDKPITVAQLLGEFVELRDPATRDDVRRLLAHTACPQTRAQLAQLVADDEAASARFENEITARRVSVYELLIRFPAIQPPFATFLDCCPPVRPRLYSIASSARITPDEISLTVGVNIDPDRPEAGARHGVSSGYLCALVPGDRVIGLVRRADPPFAPPEDPGVPMILVGPGTGFAPFRGFLHERAAQQAAGAKVAPSLVFYGCRHPQHDWLYEDEMRSWESIGIARLYLAFSTLASHPYRFVQDALWAERVAIWRAFEDGATIYVCGDGAVMAPAVRDTLLRIHEDQCRSTREEASAWLQSLIKTGRYRQDVFGEA